MLIDIPECRRCVFCLPLRHGILIFGYLNLIFALLVLALETWLTIGESVNSTMAMFRGVGMYTLTWFTMLLYSMELIFNIILVIGGHTKNKRLLRVYYYYGITTTLATFVAFIAIRFDSNSHVSSFDVMDLSFAFCGFVVQIYLLLLIRSELHKNRYQNVEMHFENHMQEVTLPPPLWDLRNPS